MHSFRGCRMLRLGWPRGWRWLALPLMLAGLSAGAEQAVDEARARLEKYVEIRRLISQEKRDFAFSQRLLGERLTVVHQEHENLRERIAAAEDSIVEADHKRFDLTQENERQKQTTSSLLETVATLEARLGELLGKLPPPIVERVKPLSQRLPQVDAPSKLSLAERFQNILGILNEVNKFNREITLTSEVRTLADGSAAEVTALYLGISHGYYANSNGTLAGIGHPTEQGWMWTAANEHAPQVAEAIAILKNERIAAFVRLPVNLQ